MNFISMREYIIGFKYMISGGVFWSHRNNLTKHIVLFKKYVKSYFLFGFFPLCISVCTHVYICIHMVLKQFKIERQLQLWHMQLDVISHQREICFLIKN